MRDDHHPERVVGAEILLRGEREVAHVVERVDAGVDAAAPHDLPQAPELEGRELVARDGLHGVVDDWVRVGGRGHGITLPRAGPRVVSTRVLILRDATTVPRCLRSSSDRCSATSTTAPRRSGCRPTSRARSRSSAPARATWCVDGLHFALVAVQGSPEDGDVPYEVRLDGTTVWPAGVRGVCRRARSGSPIRAGRSTSCSGPVASPGRTSRPTSCARTSTRTARAWTRCAPTRCGSPIVAGPRRAPTCSSCSATRSTRTSPHRRCASSSPRATGRPTRRRTSWRTSASTPWRTGRRGRSRPSAGCSPRSR